MTGITGGLAGLALILLILYYFIQRWNKAHKVDLQQSYLSNVHDRDIYVLPHSEHTEDITISNAANILSGRYHESNTPR